MNFKNPCTLIFLSFLVIQNISAQTRNFTITSGAQLVASENVHIIVHNLNFVNNGSFSPAESRVIISGDSAIQTIEGETDFYDLEVNKSSGELLLEDNISVSNTIDLQSGTVALNDHSIDLGTTGSIENENALNYIFCNCPSGEIIRTGDLDAGSTEDLGNLGLSINPSVAMGSTTIRRRHNIKNLGTDFGLSIIRSYDVSPSSGNGTLDADLSFTYFPHEENGLNTSELAFFRSADGTNWSQEGGTPGAGVVTISNWNTFSEVTLGTFNDELPVEMENIVTDCDNGKTKIDWVTASELNASHFDVLRSLDGDDWEEIATLNAHGTTTQKNYYSFSDPDVHRGEIVYYAIRQLDFDGNEEVFGPFSANCSNMDIDVTIYPNPAETTVNVIVNWNEDNVPLTITVVDMTGKVVSQQMKQVESGTNHFPINLEEFSNGVYRISLATDDQMLHSAKIVKQ
jgi:hypothetical protein